MGLNLSESVRPSYSDDGMASDDVVIRRNATPHPKRGEKKMGGDPERRAFIHKGLNREGCQGGR